MFGRFPLYKHFFCFHPDSPGCLPRFYTKCIGATRSVKGVARWIDIVWPWRLTCYNWEYGGFYVLFGVRATARH